MADEGFFDTLRNRLSWKRMRMSPTDLQSVRGSEYTYLMNGHAPEANWTGLFEPGERSPLVDTVLVKPAERVSTLITADEPGPWFFHCHIIWQMKAGMARIVYVEPPDASDEEYYYPA